MKAYLMYRNRDFDLKTSPPPFETALMQDLELDVLFSAMSGGDAFLLEVAKKAVLASLREPAAILYRQQILADCLKHPAVIREMYAITVEAIERERRSGAEVRPISRGIAASIRRSAPAIFRLAQEAKAFC